MFYCLIAREADGSKKDVAVCSIIKLPVLCVLLWVIRHLTQLKLQARTSFVTDTLP